jgi:hypothetical protein
MPPLQNLDKLCQCITNAVTSDGDRMATEVNRTPDAAEIPVGLGKYPVTSEERNKLKSGKRLCRIGHH